MFNLRSYDGYFVDLYVRESNKVAIAMYEKFGYTVYRRVLNYYSGEEDAFGESAFTSQHLPLLHYTYALFYI